MRTYTITTTEPPTAEQLAQRLEQLTGLTCFGVDVRPGEVVHAYSAATTAPSPWAGAKARAIWRADYRPDTIEITDRR